MTAFNKHVIKYDPNTKYTIYRMKGGEKPIIVNDPNMKKGEEEEKKEI